MFHAGYGGITIIVEKTHQYADYFDFLQFATLIAVYFFSAIPSYPHESPKRVFYRLNNLYQCICKPDLLKIYKCTFLVEKSICY